jgi:hypothetical protein
MASLFVSNSNLACPNLVLYFSLLIAMVTPAFAISGWQNCFGNATQLQRGQRSPGSGSRRSAASLLVTTTSSPSPATGAG